MTRRQLQLFPILIIVISFVLGACQPTEVVRTVVITEVVEGEVIEKVVTATPQPTLQTGTEPVNLRFTMWAGGPYVEMYEKMVEEFVKLHPTITVTFAVIPFADYLSKLAIELAGSDPPDLGWQLERVAPSWISAGVLADIGPELKSDLAYDYADFAPAAMALWEEGDSVYGVPFSTAPIFFVYNVDLLKLAGVQTPNELAAKGEWTWEAVASIAKAVRDLGSEYWGFLPTVNQLQVNPWGTIMPVIWAYGGDAWTKDGTECLLNSEGTVEAMELLQRMYIDRSMVPLGEEVNFAVGNVGLTQVQLGNLANFVDVNFDIAKEPSGPAGYIPGVGQAAMVVFQASRHKAEAIDLLMFMTSKEGVIQQAQFFPPARISILDSDTLLQYYPDLDPEDLRAATLDAIKEGVVLPVHVNYEKIDLAVRPFFEEIWSGADVQSTLDSACDAIQSYLVVK